MELVYLKDGQSAYLKEMIGDRYLVNKIYLHGADSEFEYTSDEDVIVREVFTTPPTAKLADEVIKLQLEKAELRSEVTELALQKRTIEYELRQVKATQVKEDKFILNFTDIINAKRLVLFETNRAMPMRVLDGDKIYEGMSIHMEVEIRYNGAEARFWGAKLYKDDRNYRGSNNFLCKEDGILVDPTDEQVNEVILKRLARKKYEPRYIAQVPDELLNKEQLTMKIEYLTQENEKNRASKLRNKSELERELKNINESLKL